MVTQIPEQTVLLLNSGQELPGWSKQIRVKNRYQVIGPASLFKGGLKDASPAASVAVVILQNDHALAGRDARIIGLLNSRGYKVICCQAGISRKSVETQCALLLAGAFKLLDSAGPGFGNELDQCLNHLLLSEAVRWQQHSETQVQMQRDGIVGESSALQQAFRLLLKYAAFSELPVLITGATGTGKELFARAVHQHDVRRRGKPFIAVNCAAISETLAESELFGHRRGAFTGAENNRQGLFRAAAEGVLFLDEISELSPASQSRLLRVIQEKKVLSLGVDREILVDVRVIAATNRNLAEMVREGTFRADLYHRLNVLPLLLPPLSERPEDLKPLSEHLLRKWHSLNPAAAVSVTDAFVAALARLDLPGNVRELENLIRQILINKSDHSPFDLCDLPPDILLCLSARPDENPQPCLCRSAHEATLETTLNRLLIKQRLNIDEALNHCEGLLLKAALETASGNQTRAASLLGITPRSVYNKIRQHNLQLQSSGNPASSVSPGLNARNHK